MEEINYSFGAKPPDVKSQRVCCGCQTPESASKPFQQQCPRCSEEGFIPALFCSQACYMQAWPRHKQWHADNASYIKMYSQHMDIAPRNRSQHEPADPMEHAPKYYGLVATAKSKFQAGDLSGSKKLLRKAMKLDTRRPEAFDKLTVCYEYSGQRNESNFYFMEAFKRYAFVALAKFGNVQDTDLAFYAWSGGVFSLAKEYFDNPELDKPDWWHHDGMVRRITKMAIGGLNAESSTIPYQIGIVYLLQAFALAGIVRHFHASFHGAEVTIPEDRTHEELVEAYCWKP
ncbi:unknown protein [Seminavis robusta]|uniref:C6H2-type domain-containing protein n=1 Tax=Seminavis robusta TaxID=568900 RepID=A0A9N8F3A8_9STRA|nr:unknown protein [Seminavis robusta]|eukprot:Sro4285_g353610.1 n/a (287) ;mRNA; r:1329-2265